METTPAIDLLDRFADAIEAQGIAAVSAELLTSLVDVARSVDASPVALEVLVDPTEPEVVRERAYCKIAIQVVGRTPVRRVVAPTAASTLRPLICT
jgi:hypothetical protein